MSAVLRSAGGGEYVLEGELTVDSVPALWPQISALAAGGETRVSCAGVSQADSAAVACLVAWARQARKAGGRLRVRDLPAVMRVIMEVSDLDGILGEAGDGAL